MNNVFTLRSLAFGSRQFVRQYAFKSELKIKWVRPEKVSCILPEKSGDLIPMPNINGQDFMPHFANSRELETAKDETKSLFKLENNKRWHTTRMYRENLVREVQRHDLDFGSMEAKLGKMTATIRAMQAEMKLSPRNKCRKVVLKELIEKRKKYLKYLRRWDYKRFEWILEKLDIVYKPPPAEFHWVTRKESLKKLAILHCEKLKQERLDAYRQILEGRQVGFLEDKLKNLEFVRREQQECQIPVTVLEDDIRAVRKQLEELKLKREEQQQH